MTPEEREWVRSVRKQAMEIVGICGLLEMEAPEGSKEAQRGHKAGLAALALADAAARRLTAANVADEAQDVAAGGYDLSALSTAPPGQVQE